MIDGIDEKSEKKALELEEIEFQSLVELCGEEAPDINKIAANIEKGLANGNNKLKLFLAKGLYEQGKIDEAFEMLKGVPENNSEARELHRALRYADEARGIVSNVNPETDKYFEELNKRLGIKTVSK